ncbi:uncharacterized protein [Porites lutea]|uniref:uncharacterized protein isoform X7 n=1 Tax=Porites lutea TaxID=51062 RepID=UPI003CC63DBB
MFVPIFCCLLFDTIWCYVEVTESPVWPSGSYALPMTDTGCPEDKKFSWYTGLRIEELESNQNGNKHSARIHSMSKIETPYIKRYFCVKNDTETDESRPKWPDGTYCIYKKGYFCPQGFHEGYVFWDDNNGINGTNNNSRTGELPEGVYNQDTLIYFCCKKTGSAMKRISLPVNTPFYLLAFEAAICQEVEGAVYSLEYIVFDTEDTNNQDARFYPYPYAAHRRDPTIYYCYYRECKLHLGQSRGTFASPYFPDNYHDYQDCQWNITVPKGCVIRLKFDVFELESTPFSCGGGQCSCDYVEVKEESTLGDLTVLGRYCMMATPPNIIESSTNRLIVTFHSDHAISAKGFNASYTTIASITDRNTRMSRTTSSSAVMNMRSSSRSWANGVFTTGTEEAPTGYKTTGRARNNVTIATEGLLTRGSFNQKERTITYRLNMSSITPNDPSQLSQDNTLVTLNVQSSHERKRLTPTNPAHTERKSGEMTHRYVGQSSELSKPPRNSMGLPLKYFLVIIISLVLLVLGLACLVFKLCKRRELLIDHGQLTTNNPLYESYVDGTNAKEARTENPLYA